MHYQTGALCEMRCCRKFQCYTFLQSRATVKGAISSSTCFSVAQYFDTLIYILQVCTHLGTVSIRVIREMVFFPPIKAILLCLKIYRVWSRFLTYRLGCSFEMSYTYVQSMWMVYTLNCLSLPLSQPSIFLLPPPHTALWLCAVQTLIYTLCRGLRFRL